MANTIVTVSNSSELDAALQNATGGETILLAAGDYGRLTMKGGAYQYASTVTIKSADTTTPATISELRVDGASNITFQGLSFDYTFSGASKTYAPFQVTNSQTITFAESIFDGDVAQGVSSIDDGYGTGKGLVVSNSSEIAVVDSEFHTFWKGLQISNTTDATVSGNNVHSIRSDGMNFIDVYSIVIEQNYIHDFSRSLNSGDHGDFIQFWNSGNGPASHDVILRDNILDKGTGDYIQSIFFDNGTAGSGSAGDPNFIYQNILIENNVIYGNHTHGISIGLSDNLVIRNNSLYHVDGQLADGVGTPNIRVVPSSTNVTIDGNVSPGVVGYSGQSSWTVTNNVTAGKAEYPALLTMYATAQADGYNQYGVQTGSLIEQTGAGSDIVYNYPFAPDSYTTLATSSTSTGGTSTSTTGTTGTTTTDTSGTTTDTSGSTSTHTSDTTTDTSGSTATTDISSSTSTDTSTTTASDSTSTDTSASTDTSGTTTTDTSGGETTADASTSTSTDTSGTTTDTSGTTAGSATGGTTSSSPLVLDDYVLDFAAIEAAGGEVLNDDAQVVHYATHDAIRLDGSKDYVDLGRLEEFEQSDKLAFSIEFARDQADGSAQRILWNQKKFGITVEGDGLRVHVANEENPLHKGFHIANLGLNDTDSHEISVIVDQTVDRLQVIVDDQLVMDESGTDFDFVGAGGREWGWNLGSPWSRFADGEITDFRIDDDVDFVDMPLVQDDSLVS